MNGPKLYLNGPDVGVDPHTLLQGGGLTCFCAFSAVDYCCFSLDLFWATLIKVPNWVKH